MSDQDEDALPGLEVGSVGEGISEYEATRTTLRRIRQHADIDASRIQVSYKDGEITLRGSIFSEAVRQEAEEAARGVPNVSAVHNQLQIVPRGLGNQPPAGCGNVGRGMEVFGSDGAHIGRVKDIEVERFLVVRPGARDVFVPFAACEHVKDGRVYLDVASSQVDAMGWDHPEPFAPVP